MDNEAFWSKVDKTGNGGELIWNGTPCWIWTASRKGTNREYGSYSLNGDKWLAHRFAWCLENGRIPEGKELDHLCRNTICVRPNHMEAVTHQVNIKRGASQERLRTHCPQGHEYTAANTWTSKRGWRYCRECNKLKLRRMKAARLAA